MGIQIFIRCKFIGILLEVGDSFGKDCVYIVYLGGLYVLLEVWQ